MFSGDCGCFRSVVDTLIPMDIPTQGAGLEPYKSLTPYLATSPNGAYIHEQPWIRYGFGALEIGGRFLDPNFKLVNLFGSYALRQGLRINNYMGFRARFQLKLPAEFSAYSGTIRLVALTNSGGVKLKTKPAGGTYGTVIDQPGYRRSRLYCADAPVTLTPGVATDEVELMLNIADGNSLYYDTSSGHGAYGGLFLGYMNETVAGLPMADASMCGQDVYHPDDPQKPAGAWTQTDVFGDVNLGIPGKGFFTVLKEVMQVTETHRVQFGLPECKFTD